jgi:hypothetical protein
MAQLFSRAASVRLNLILLTLLIVLPVAAGAVWWGLYQSPLRTRRGIAVEQPIPFSHKHHAGELGIDCRYCHDSVERSAFAGIPPVHTCMSCHSQVWKTAAMLEPVRAAERTGIVLPWVRVNDLPQYTYFDHSAHVNHGVGCSTCHGRVDRMETVAPAVTFDMRWCLECHRDPAAYLRPRDQVMEMAWAPAANQRVLGRKLIARYGIETKHLMDCATCHR